MKNRSLEKMFVILIILTCIFGLLFQFGLVSGTQSFASLSMFSVIGVLITLIYYLIELYYLKARNTGVALAGLKYASFITITSSSLIEWVFLTPFHSGLAENELMAMYILHAVLPIEVIVEWFLSEKGHYRKKFILIGMAPTVLYGAVAIILGAVGMGIQANGTNYPYYFMNVDLLGYPVVLETCALYAIGLFAYCEVICAIDRRLFRKYKR